MRNRWFLRAKTVLFVSILLALSLSVACGAAAPEPAEAPPGHSGTRRRTHGASGAGAYGNAGADRNGTDGGTHGGAVR